MVRRTANVHVSVHCQKQNAHGKLALVLHDCCLIWCQHHQFSTEILEVCVLLAEKYQQRVSAERLCDTFCMAQCRTALSLSRFSSSTNSVLSLYNCRSVCATNHILLTFFECSQRNGAAMNKTFNEQGHEKRTKHHLRKH